MKNFLIIFYLFSFSLFAEYPERYFDYAEKFQRDTAIMLTAFNRPQYLTQTLEALSKNPEIDEIPIFFILDGGPNAKQDELIEVIESFHFPHIEIIAREENYGCGRNLIDARRFLFDHCHFDKVIVMEDDLVIAPQGIGLLLRMHRWCRENLPNFGAVTLWSQYSASRGEKKHYLRYLTDPPIIPEERYPPSYKEYGNYFDQTNLPKKVHFYRLPCMWVYCLDRQCWDEIKDILYTYESRFLQGESYHKRDNPAIRHWIWQKLLKAKFNMPKINPSRYEIVGDPYLITTATTQDAMTAMALRIRGLRYMMPLVNRMENIGVEGLHFDEKMWKRMCGNLKLDIFEEDADLEVFSCIKNK